MSVSCDKNALFCIDRNLLNHVCSYLTNKELASVDAVGKGVKVLEEIAKGQKVTRSIYRVPQFIVKARIQEKEKMFRMQRGVCQFLTDIFKEAGIYLHACPKKNFNDVCKSVFLFNNRDYPSRVIDANKLKDRITWICGEGDGIAVLIHLKVEPFSNGMIQFSKRRDTRSWEFCETEPHIVDLVSKEQQIDFMKGEYPKLGIKGTFPPKKTLVDLFKGIHPYIGLGRSGTSRSQIADCIIS